MDEKGLAKKAPFEKKANESGKSGRTQSRPAAKIKEVSEVILSNGLFHFRHLTATEGLVMNSK